MFEEVPRDRRGLRSYVRIRSLGISRLAARRIVLGPFMIGGGLLLAAVGGSVAVAATVFTATTIRANDVPPHPRQPLVLAVSSPASEKATAPASTHRVPVVHSASAQPSAAPGSPSQPAPSAQVWPGRPRADASPSGSAVTRPNTPLRHSTAPASSNAPSSSPSPDGNALVYVSGWDSGAQQVLFEFASVSKGTGPQHSDVYSITSPRQYTATLAVDLRVVSGGRVCPPPGSTCSTDQLIAASARGFYAEVAIDPASAMHVVLERDNVNEYAPILPVSSPVGPAPSPTAQPSA